MRVTHASLPLSLMKVTRIIASFVDASDTYHCLFRRSRRGLVKGRYKLLLGQVPFDSTCTTGYLHVSVLVAEMWSEIYDYSWQSHVGYVSDWPIDIFGYVSGWSMVGLSSLYSSFVRVKAIQDRTSRMHRLTLSIGTSFRY